MCVCVALATADARLGGYVAGAHGVMYQRRELLGRDRGAVEAKDQRPAGLRGDGVPIATGRAVHAQVADHAAGAVAMLPDRQRQGRLVVPGRHEG